MGGERPLLFFAPNPNFNQDFNVTILEPLSMLEKALKMLLNISGNVMLLLGLHEVNHQF